MVEIETLKITSGELPRRAQELVLDWAELHHKSCLKIGDCAWQSSSQTLLPL
jgi:hypothetical protein